MALTVTPILKGTLPVNLASAYNLTANYKKGSRFEPNAGADGGGYAFAQEMIGQEQVGAEVVFRLRPANAPDAVTGKKIDLPPGRYSGIRLLATAVEGNQTRQQFTMHYTDGTSSTITQSLSDWAGSARFRGESPAVDLPYRITGDGSTDANPFHLYAYSLPVDPAKELRGLSLPANRNVVVFAVTLVPANAAEP